MNTGLQNAPGHEIKSFGKKPGMMKESQFSKIVCLLLLPVLLGCAGVRPEEPVTAREPSAPVIAVAPAPAPSVPDETETARLQAKELLLGKWRRVQGGDTIEFLEDDTVSLYSAVEKVSYPGSYRILDKERLEITMKKGGTLTWGYIVTKGELTLTAPTGVEMKYRRYRGR